MNPNPIFVAAKAKGPILLFRRTRSIAQRYGLDSDKMGRALQQFSDVLRRFDCGATFPITAVTLKRHGSTIAKFLNTNIEFAVHGYTHVDYEQLAPEMQLAHLQRACAAFANLGIKPVGFRSPYLRRETHFTEAIEAAGFSYVSNQPVLWNVLTNGTNLSSTNSSYERALAFYDPWRVDERPSLPRRDSHLVEIPVSLPDDEILIERLGGRNGLVKEAWLRILSQSYQLGELFTLQLHPERIAKCVEALSAVLAEAQALTPVVWCARLDEIAAWWKARAEAGIQITSTNDREYQCVVSGPHNATVLVRSVEAAAPCSPWMDGYQEVKSRCFTLKSPCRPLIGLSPSTPSILARFLQQQGYIVETSQQREGFLTS